jgi:mannosylglucosylglycerate synthase
VNTLQSRFSTGPVRVGFVSTRFAGTDGVSLETAKWATVLEELGCECYYMAGQLDRPPERSFLVEEAHFSHPEIRSLYHQCFGVRVRPASVTKRIMELKDALKEQLRVFVAKYGIRILLIENASCIPLNLPLGLAITEFIAETGSTTIAHHHDFFWERKQFLVNCVWDYLNMAFPPHLPFIHHVVINSSGANQLSLRTGVSSATIPNVMDFDSPPPQPDAYAADIRQVLGIPADELFVLQPTRVVMRKGIEHAIELVSRLGMKARLVISHASGDEGYDYETRVREYSRLMGVDTIFVSDIIGEERGMTADGRKIYTLYDIYPYADLVTYPSSFEGFGNAFLEAIYFRKPIVVNSYSVYAVDIKPRCFQVIEMDGYISDLTLAKTREVLSNPVLRQEMVDQNYELGRRHYSFDVLRRKLEDLLADCLNEELGLGS